MANINRQWKKFMAVGCSHGYWADETALDAVLTFKDRYKPDTTIHLGDYIDTTTFRSGANRKEQAGATQRDVECGITFLSQLQPDILFNGNHDIRLWEAADDPTDGKNRDLAQIYIAQIKEALPKKITFIESYRIDKSFYKLADTTLAHGFMFSENAIRDHVETYGKCLIAHLHKVGSSPGRTIDSPTGYCVGYLGDIDKFTYAHRKRSTLGWSQGFAWGEYSNDEMMILLSERNKEGKWRLPL